MSLLISTKAELIKTKRSVAFWLSILGAGLIPLIFFIVYLTKPTQGYSTTWAIHFMRTGQSFCSFLLPMFVILICSLVPQIEYKNNAWKQVFASPQPIGNVFFSKYIAIFFMVILLFVMFNVFVILSAIIPNLFYPKYKFLDTSINWGYVIKMNIKIFAGLLGIISIQYWLSLRFRNFIVPISIGLALLIASLILIGWEHVDKAPYAFPLITFMTNEGGRPLTLFQNHEWNAVVYFVIFTLIAFADLRFRKERG